MAKSIAEAVVSERDVMAEALGLRKSALLTAAVGSIHSILLIAAFLLVRKYGAGPNPTEQEIIDYINDEERRRIVLIAGIYLIPFAGIAFIWFTVSLRMWLQGSVRRLTPLLANVLLVCGVVYVAILFCAGASMSVLAITSEAGISDEAAISLRQFPQYGTTLLLVFAMRMCAMIVFALSNIGRTYGVLPKWFAYLGFLLGVLLLLTASLSPWLILLFPLWLLGLSTSMLIRAWNIPKSIEIIRERQGPAIEIETDL